MIRLKDASILAITKLRTRRIRLSITVFISALIFSGLMAASFISNGVFNSINSFSQEGFGDRYVMSAMPNIAGASDPFQNKDIMKRAEAIHKELTERKKKEAKRLGVVYDTLTEPRPVEEFEGPNGKEKTLNPTSPASIQAIKEYAAKNPRPGIDELKQLGDKYGALGYYQSINLPQGGSDTPNLAVLKNGKEEYKPAGNQNFNPFQTGTDSFTTSWQLMSSGLLEPFLLPGQSAVESKGMLPVVAPYTAVEQLLGLEPLPPAAKPAEKLERLKQVRAQAADLSFSVCHRNKTSAELINQTLSTQQEIEQNKDKKDYQKPSLIYGLPEKPCGPVLVESDKRTALEKKQADKEAEFRRLFGEQPPKQTILKFKVVGIGPDPIDFFSSPSVSGILQSLLSSNLGQASWLTPIEARDNQPLLKTFFPPNPTDISQAATLYTELPDAASARNLLKNENCEPNFEFAAGPVVSEKGAAGVPDDPYAKCYEEGKYFTIFPFGSNSLAVEEAKKGFSKVFKIAAMVVTVLAAIIMIGTVGRVIADSRRETAVFRAIGAKRLDIAQIYFTYTVFLAALVAASALLIGFILASIAQQRWSDGLTIDLLVAFNAQDLGRQFNLFGFNLGQVLTVAGLILLAGLASAVLPLLSNIRRNPIRDMRDEN